MAQTAITHPYTVKFWYPVDAAEEDASIACTIKAPEIGDSYTYGRDQHISKTRGGDVVVFDYGAKFTPDITLSFKEVPDRERSALMVFLDMVGWAKNAIAYKDIDGVIKAVIVSKPSVSYKSNGYINRYVSPAEATYDFDLALMDVSNSYQTINGGLVTDSALTLHLADFNAPHSPEKTVAIVAADGAKVVDTIKTKTYHGVIWIGTVVSGANKLMFQAQCLTDRTGTAIATTRVESVSTSNGVGDAPTDIAITTDIAAGATDDDQVMRLKIAVGSGLTYSAIFRSIFVGKR